MRLREINLFITGHNEGHAFQWGIFSYYDNNGYLNYRYGAVNDDEMPVSVFTSKDKAKIKAEFVHRNFRSLSETTGLYDTDGALFSLSCRIL